MLVLTEHKRLVAKWISGCDDMLAEIEYLLDKAYPEGAEDRFYSDWDDVLEHNRELKEEHSVMDKYRDKGMSPGDFFREDI